MIPQSLLFIVMFSIATMASPYRSNTNNITCYNAVKFLPKSMSVPKEVLFSVGLNESGLSSKGHKIVWPWTINVEGKSYYFKNKTLAIQRTQALLKEGKKSIDVGCFQINLKWHSGAFKNLQEAFDPYKNARYAARFLHSNYELTGNWSEAVKKYHSNTQQYALVYLNRYQSNAQYTEKQKVFSNNNNYPKSVLNQSFIQFN